MSYFRLLDNDCTIIPKVYIKNADMFSIKAVQKGHLEMLKKMKHLTFVPILCDIAAARNDLECLKYVLEMGCKWHVETTYDAAENVYSI
jgi:hypothetical protein